MSRDDLLLVFDFLRQLSDLVLSNMRFVLSQLKGSETIEIWWLRPSPQEHTRITAVSKNTCKYDVRVTSPSRRGPSIRKWTRLVISASWRIGGLRQTTSPSKRLCIPCCFVGGRKTLCKVEIFCWDATTESCAVKHWWTWRFCNQTAKSAGEICGA